MALELRLPFPCYPFEERVFDRLSYREITTGMSTGIVRVNIPDRKPIKNPISRLMGFSI
jgi:hypothetical protein